MIRPTLLRGVLLLLIAVAAGCGTTIGGGPAQVSPANGATLGCADLRYVFTWTKAVGALGYTLEVHLSSPDTIVATVAIDDADTLSGSVLASALTCGGTEYRWKVCAQYDGINPTPSCSGFWTFKVM